MSGAPYLAFLAVSTAVIVVPGPSILLIVANALRGGARPGLATVAGTSLAMAAQLVVAVTGLSALMSRLAGGQSALRWFGVAVLAWLGVRSLRSTAESQHALPAGELREPAAFSEGFVVSLTNPTTLLFFVGFFPQFLPSGADPGRGLLLLGVSFWALALAFDCAYALLAARIGRSIRDPRRAALRNRAAGAVLLAAALALALMRISDAALI